MRENTGMKKTPLSISAFLLAVVLSACATAEPPVTTKNEPAQYENTVVSLTFDDGDADNYQTRDMLKDNDLRATFYIISGFTGTEGYMTADELRGLYADGNEIGGHTVNHINLTTVRGADLKREVCQGRLTLLGYGFDVQSFAYPYGHYDEESKQAVMDCGYNNARIVTGGPENIPAADAYTLRAFPYIVKDTQVRKMANYIIEAEKNGGGWVIFTFHHVCDKCDQYATTPERFSQFAQWLGAQQKKGLVVKTVGEVTGGEVKPGVQP
jgi:peptidoglycan/xylan/chitin deacetylase (PgdA/CDA1 family)